MRGTEHATQQELKEEEQAEQAILAYEKAFDAFFTRKLYPNEREILEFYLGEDWEIFMKEMKKKISLLFLQGIANVTSNFF